MVDSQSVATLGNRVPIVVLGAAVVDVIARAEQLPQRGGDSALQQQSISVGGCALNVALALHRLGMDAVSALPLGQGVWAELLRQKLTACGLTSVTETHKGDNGWCLALVEPDGERTFLSVAGVENQWDEAMLASVPLHAEGWLYLSGYQLIGKNAETLLSWLEGLANRPRLAIDFGPRLPAIAPDHWQRVMALQPLITLNRQEAEHVWHQRLQQDGSFNAQALITQWAKHFASPLVVRLDSEGAGFSHHGQYGWIAAFKTAVVDTIGAGDSHTGGLLAALASGWPLDNAVALGNAVASFVVAQRGGDTAPDRAALIRHWQQCLTRQ